jgi:hypothetical protein
MSTETHLWEPEHPYYCNEGCYYATGHHHVYPTWAAFVADGDLLYDGDHDLNLLFRWDWMRPDPNDYVEGEEMRRDDSLQLFYVIQRKAFTLSVEIGVVTAVDEPAVRAWLTERAKTVTALWAPLNLAPSGGAA